MVNSPIMGQKFSLLEVWLNI